MRTQLMLAGISLVFLCSCSSETATPGDVATGGTSNLPGTGGAGNSTNGNGGASVGLGGSNNSVNTGGSVSASNATSMGGSATTTIAANSGGITNSDGAPIAGGTPANAGGKSSTNNPSGGKADGGSSQGSAAGGSAGKATTGGNSAVGAAGTTNLIGKGGTGGNSNAGGASVGGTSSGTGGTTSTAAVGCSREGLQAAVDAYLATQQSGDISKMPLATTVKYTENFKTATQGIWQTALTVAFQRSLLDVTACQTFTEVFVTPGDHQYVLGIRLAVADGKISEIESIVTDGTVSGTTITSDDWNFDAKAYMECAKSEDWSLVPTDKQSSREALIAAGEAYFKIFSDKTTQVPWGEPCYRLEGGKGCTPAIDKASKSCNVGIPDGITFKNTHWVVDVELNAAVGFTLFAGGSPDTHLFRLVDGKIRYVHTLTQGTG